MLAEGRRVVANIERVARLFVTKTVYAAIIAIAVGAAGITYPFFPRHLTIISTLTIGVPGFFLALAPGAPRARPGFTRRVLVFTIPAGAATAAAALASYAIARGSGGTGVTARTSALLATFAVALWVLALVAGRPDGGPGSPGGGHGGRPGAVVRPRVGPSHPGAGPAVARDHRHGGRRGAGRHHRAHPLASLLPRES
jgi:hypothetical protein